MRSLLPALIISLAILPGTSLGAQPIEQFHGHFTDSFSQEICPGLIVDSEVVGSDNFFVYADESFKDTASIHWTFTNPVNGKSVLLSSAGQTTGTAIVDEEAGTITFRSSYKGLPEKIQTDQGPVLTRDAGIITFVDTFDLETGELTSSDVIIKGPTPKPTATSPSSARSLP